MKIINDILSAIFKRKVELAFDYAFLYKIRNFSDGITFFEFYIDCNFYVENHNPKIDFHIIFLNHMIIQLELYNRLHEEYQQVVREHD